ncbi:nuclear transport factor 2 family protein [Streptomyces sp. NPDC051840]|uniref:nuclear transport factor 2 family protein n=1 Tax=Streptomyces sp. NPDC051840 TaxID=3154752 RepID=UPI0034203F04
MDVNLDPNDATAVRNKDLLLALYDEMINGKSPLQAVRTYLVPEYVQHNPRLPTTADGTGEAFEQRVVSNPNLRVEVHRVIAAGDYVWAHVNFINIYSNDPDDRGVAGVDIFKFAADGKIVEHWDVLQPVMDPAEAANDNGMF